MSKAKMMPITYDIPCQSYGCTERAKWMITSHEEALINAAFLCDGCAESVFESMLHTEVAKKVLDRLAGVSRETLLGAQNAPGSALKPKKDQKPPPNSKKPQEKPRKPSRKPKGGQKGKKSPKKQPSGGAKSAEPAPSAPDQPSKPT